jgi:hypothetical protein
MLLEMVCACLIFTVQSSRRIEVMAACVVGQGCTKGFHNWSWNLLFFKVNRVVWVAIYLILKETSDSPDCQLGQVGMSP